MGALGRALPLILYGLGAVLFIAAGQHPELNLAGIGLMVVARILWR